jgi:hypothetical protein
MVKSSSMIAVGFAFGCLAGAVALRIFSRGRSDVLFGSRIRREEETSRGRRNLDPKTYKYCGYEYTVSPTDDFSHNLFSREP